MPETAGSALYAMVDVLSATGNLWQALVGAEGERRLIRPRIVSPSLKAFQCGNDIPVTPQIAVGDDPKADILILRELWLGPDEHMKGRYPELVDWVPRKYREGTLVYSACSGAVMVAETGLLDGREATSHWGYEDLFRKHYPKVRFRPEPSIAFADSAGRIVTAGGGHLLARRGPAYHFAPLQPGRGATNCQGLPPEMAWRGPASLCEPGSPQSPCGLLWCAHARSGCPNISASRIRPQVPSKPGTSPSGPWSAAALPPSGSTLIVHVQNLRVEEAKRLLESGGAAVDEISADVGYEDPAFFRRLFKRRTGLTPSQYRRMFQSISQPQTIESAGGF